jgi:hypothetical protein
MYVCGSNIDSLCVLVCQFLVAEVFKLCFFLSNGCCNA